MIALDPTDPRLSPVVRWIMLHRTGDYWYSTRDTSATLAALCDYLAAQPPSSASGAVTVRLNGASLRTVALDADTVREQEVVLRVPVSQLRPDKNDVVFERTGAGATFYSVEMRQTVASEDIPALANAQLSVKRKYLRVLSASYGEAAWDMKTEPTNNSMRQDDRIVVRLVVNAPRDMDYVLIEDRFPAGCEPEARGSAEDITDWSFWWSSTTVLDDRIAFFARTLPKGEHVIEYNLRAQTPGSYHVMPAMLQAMYAPETRAESSEARVEIAPQK
jgi:hypothetical protein